MPLRLGRVLFFVGVLLVPAAAPASNVRVAAAAPRHTCVVTTAGEVRCWGSNASGQLGDGTTTDRATPTAVSGLTTGIASVAAGPGHTCALTTGGAVKCWGDNYYGQLGDGSTTSRLTPVSVGGLTSGVVAIAVGTSHSCALVGATAVKCWGLNYSGQLGDNTTTCRSNPVNVVNLPTGVTSLSAGGNHTCAVTSGAAKCWGDNDRGQLGDGSTTDRWTPVNVSTLASGMAAVAAGAQHTCALTTGGGVKCWGFNLSGQLGDGTTTSRTTCGNVSGLTSGVATLAAGSNHTCAVMTGGGLKCWGYDAYGLVDGQWKNSLVPYVAMELALGASSAAAGETHTCAVTKGGGLRCAGGNYDGQLGDGTTAYRATPVGVPGLTSGVSALALGIYHTCALTAAGAVRCWGENALGQVGDGSTTLRTEPTQVAGLGSGVASASARSYYSCALTTGGAVKCWGNNAHGQLGDGTHTASPTPVTVSGLAGAASWVSAGLSHACAVVSGGVKCWGNNTNGQLGNGTTTSSLTPVDVSGLVSGAATVAAGSTHTCALLTGGGVRCWGSNGDGELGDGTTAEHWTPASVSGLTGGVSVLAAGGYHSCVVTTAGAVKCWGDNLYGQVGNGTTYDQLTPVTVSGFATGGASVSAGTQGTCAVTTGGAVKCWGDNAYGQLGDGTIAGSETPVSVTGLTSGVASVGVGSVHACALTTGGAVKCWGNDEFGQVGDRIDDPPFAPVKSLGFGRADFDGDDRVDAAVFRPSSGTWFSLDSTSDNATYRHRGWGVQAQGDRPVVGDFDGDGTLDPTVFRPSSGTWFILKSSSDFTTWSWIGWGASTDTLVPGDYDGDGTTDAAVFRPSTGTWYIKPSSGATQWNVTFGNATDIPVPGHWDADGKADIAVYRPSTGTWFVLTSSSGYASYWYKGWGVNANGDTPAPGDYDGDGKLDPCVFRPTTGTWFMLESHASFATWNYVGWGTNGDTVVPGDYDGDGITDTAVYRPSNYTWYIRPSSGATQWSVVFGQAGDVPLITIR